MARSTASCRKSPSVNGSATVDSVVEIVRSLWQAVEGTPGADQVKLKRDITQTINRLRGRVEGRLGQPLGMATAVAVTECSVVRLEKSAMIAVLHDEPVFSALFISYLLTHNIRIAEDLVDQLFNSSEKRLTCIR